MFSAFFGHFLLNEALITKKQLVKALDAQDKIRLKLGTMAINAKLMTVQQVEEIHMQQLTCDERFGSLAVAAGYLTKEGLNELLNAQHSEHLLLAQSLVDLDILTFDEFQTHLNAYIAKHALTDDALKGLITGDVDHVVNTFVDFIDDEHKPFYTDLVTLFIKNQIRFINSHIRIGTITTIETKQYDHLIRQTIKGDHRYFTAIAGDTASLIAFASLYANEKFKVFGEYPIDAIGEYLNQNNGLFIVNKSNEGIKLTMDIQTHIVEPTLNPYRPLYDIPIHFIHGEIHLILGEL